MKALLVSTYDLGRQPFGLASPAAWLKAAGFDVTCVDVAKQPLADDVVAAADIVAFYLPMHTATRLAAPLVGTVRRLNPPARVCAYGLYAPLNGELLKQLGVDAVFGGEFEQELTTWALQAGRKPEASLKACATHRDTFVAQAFRPAKTVAQAFRPPRLPRLHFLVPDRSGLPPLTKYATLQMPDGTRRAVGYTEASRGCKHLCRHCPVVPIYNGQFRIVQPEVVLADIAAQIDAGARHVTFGDPDFFNGPTHAMRIVESLHAAHPDISFDVTIKIEHLLKHRELLPRLQESGCAFITSAVESIDDEVLAILEKRHTRADFIDAVALCRAAGIALVPTFVAFHPWISLRGYCELLDVISDLDLVDHVAPIQLAIRLLIPEGSLLLTHERMRPFISAFDSKTLTHRWIHPDPRVDALHGDVTRIIGSRVSADRRAVFDEISTLAHARAGIPRRSTRPARARATVPYLNEPWYC